MGECLVFEMLSLKEFKSIKTDHLVNALGIIIFERIKFNQIVMKI